MAGVVGEYARVEFLILISGLCVFVFLFGDDPTENKGKERKFLLCV